MRHLLPALAIGALACASPALATPATDPAGDFLSTYTGPKNGDLDVLAADVGYNGAQFIFSATLNGPIGTTSGAFYVWGIDRGTGTARFNVANPTPIGSGILFDLAVALTPSTGALTVGGTGVGANGTFSVNGNSIVAFVNASLFPAVAGQSTDPLAWSWSFWPRIPAAPQVNGTIPDFAPDNSTLRISAVPEPSTWALLGLGLASFAFAARRRRTM